MSRGFETAEFRQRTAGLQAAMAEHDLGALLLTTPADIYYVTGFLTRFWESPTRPWFVVVPADAPPVAVIPSIGASLMSGTWIEEIRTWNAPDPDDDGVALLADTLREVTTARGRIGVSMGPETHLRMPLADFERLRAAIAPMRIDDASPALRYVRETKSEAEIGKIRAACRAAGAAFGQMDTIAGPGRPLEQVFRDFQIACLREGADWVSYLAGGAGPGGYGDVISPASARPLAAGDVLMLDTGAVCEGYFCDFDRNFAIGRAEEAAQRAHETLFAATEAGLAATRPGATAAELHRTMAEEIGRHGGAVGSARLGHGLGLQLTEWPSLIPGDRTVLREGMVLTLEPGIEIAPGRIMVHEENIVVRASGAELLSPRAPAELPVLGKAP